jgi:hypothetical protein
MKGLIHGGLSTLLLAIATTGLVSSASAKPATEPSSTRVESNIYASAPLLPSSSMTFNFTAPFIMDSGVLGSNHFIRIAVVGMALEDVMISLPKQMERFDNLEVRDGAGKRLSAKTSITKDRVVITFDQPLPAGSYLEILFTGVEMRGVGGETLFYGVTAERVGTTGEIPVGTARVQIPSRS